MKTRGITLIEIIVYIGLLSIMAIFVSNSLIQISDTSIRARTERELLSDARLILETIAKTAGESAAIYSPTSVFLSDTSQLSLITTVNPPAEHTGAYADFYIDNGRMWTKKEGSAAASLSSATVRITKFRLERIMQGLNREAVAITLQIVPASSKYPVSIMLNTTVALRGSY